MKNKKPKTYHFTDELSYAEYEIPKKNGKMRLIVAPNRALKKHQRHVMHVANDVFIKMLGNPKYEKCKDTFYGFLKNHSATECARQHIGYKTTIMMDIKDFFNTVTQDMVEAVWEDPLSFFSSKVVKSGIKVYHEKGYTAQGFPSSPILANLALLNVIPTLKDNVSKVIADYRLTIYADDVQISVNTEDYTILNNIIATVERTFADYGLTINRPKTRIKYAKFGFRRILGVNVGDNETRATRKIMRKLRAATHQNKYTSKGGLSNWKNCSTYVVGADVGSSNE